MLGLGDTDLLHGDPVRRRDLVDKLRGSERRLLGREDVDRGFGQHELDRLVLGQRLAERLTLLDVL